MEEDKLVPGFNKGQSQAILASTDKDILINAGAGSGKTKTLSEKVFRTILKEEVKPSELLVLTFTNNAAHEMKERILLLFNKGDEKDKADKMLSSHIQTFDSLYQQLCSQYSKNLGLPKNLNVLNESLAIIKKNQIIDDIFIESFSDDDFVDFFSYFNGKNMETAKKNILSLWELLEKLDQKEQKDFFEDYEEKYLSLNFVKTKYHEVILEAKEEIKRKLYEVAFSEYFPEVYAKESADFDAVFSSFNSEGFWGKNYDSFSFANEEFNNSLYRKYCELLKIESDEDFVRETKEFYEKAKKDIFSKRPFLKKDDPNNPYYNKTFGLLKHILEDGILDAFLSLNTIDEEYRKLLETKTITLKSLSIVKEAMKRFYEYKMSSASFEFSDFCSMSLKLLTSIEFQDVAEEIRSRFTYIMIDEYQDTNPPQEAFIEALLKQKKDGSYSHLFVVGDPKQSIYYFRGSEVSLFKDRERRYKTGDGQQVISMNTNYRSGPALLNDINRICESYMRVDHGAIDYKNSEADHLRYDEKVNLYKEKYPNFGVHRYIVPDLPISHFSLNSSQENESEAIAIVNDIKSKIDSGYQVYEKGKGLRKCKASDFAILSRVKTNFSMYERYFSQMGIKLNKSIPSSLRELDSIIYLESLLKMVNRFIGGDEDADEKHLFMSIARSYVYQYDDNKLYHIIYDGSYKNDPLYLKIKNFSESHKNETLRVLYLNILNEFNVVKDLYKIGGCEDTISKIESFYNLVISAEREGLDLTGFIALFEISDKKSIEISADSLTQNEDAVDMMTIHASKGLERKIVYLPARSCKFCRGSGNKGQDFTFSKANGAGFYNYNYPLPERETLAEDTLGPEISYQTIANYSILKGNNPDIDDHVRLFYVALTRAENEVIIVGHNGKGDKETLYDMLDTMPKRLCLNKDYLYTMVSKGVLAKNLVDELIIENEKTTQKPLSLNENCLDNNRKKVYGKLANDFLKPFQLNIVESRFNGIIEKLFDYYISKIKELTSIDEKATIFAMAKYPYLASNYKINSFDSLLLAYNESPNLDIKGFSSNEDTDDNFSDDSNENDDALERVATSEAERFLIKSIQRFFKGLANYDIKLLGEKTPKKGENPKLFIGQKYLVPLARYFDSPSFIAYESYKNADYEDSTFFYDPYKTIKLETKLPTFSSLKIDNSPIVFAKKEKRRASKKISFLEGESPSESLLEEGTHLHRLMELIDIKNPNLDFIEDQNEKNIIKGVLDTDIMKLAKEGEIYTEYGFYDPINNSTGSIDLLFRIDDQFYIVDYKTLHIDDPAYIEQLHIYRDNVERLFGTDAKNIHMYLLSLVRQKTKEVY